MSPLEAYHPSLAVASLAVGGVAAALVRLVRRSRPGESVGWAVAGVVSMGGVWAAVPDTEIPLTTAIVTTVVVVAAARGRLDRGERWLWAALGVVAAVGGGRGTDQLAGGVAAAALLAALPSVGPAGAVAVGPAVVVHAVAVALASRVMTRWEAPGSVVGAVALVAALAALTRTPPLRPVAPGRPAPGLPRGRRAARRLRRRPPHPRRRGTRG